ncbi:copper homeostasis protein CutC [Cellulomonas fimi]|uniref:PF03932 family protein CutC n=2 Tax=Cellulomonas fimi TaxID=1708 RepID=A0A7Y0LZE2_CELFI|nr:copper homeostasis protein CutC [Cellulomonas fimi]
MIAVEIATQSLQGARTAFTAGADRVELGSALGLTGGLTPGGGLLRAVLDVGIPVHVLVRPRPGGFVHDADEADVLLAEVRHAVAAGAAGVVLGALTPDLTLDEPLIARLVEAAAGAEVTFHRAIDVVDDPVAVIRRLDALGVTRVLTSAGAARAVDGLTGLAALVEHAGSVQVMAGGGVRPGDVAALASTGVVGVHLSARAERPDPGPVGPGGGTPAPLETTDADLVRAAVEAARRVEPRER